MSSLLSMKKYMHLPPFSYLKSRNLTLLEQLMQEQDKMQ